jgi:hypothetical protein
VGAVVESERDRGGPLDPPREAEQLRHPGGDGSEGG